MDVQTSKGFSCLACRAQGGGSISHQSSPTPSTSILVLPKTRIRITRPPTENPKIEEFSSQTIKKIGCYAGKLTPNTK